MIWWLKFWQDMTEGGEKIIRSLSGSAWGVDALDAARLTLGMGEQGGNNRGPNLDALRRGGPGGPWCAAAASYWIEEGYAASKGADGWDCLSAIERDLCPVRRSHGARKLWRRAARAGRIVEEPLPGDLVLWRRPGPAWAAHVGIVETVTGDAFVSIEGNRGRYNVKTGHGSKVRRYSHEFSEREFVGFARLP